MSFDRLVWPKPVQKPHPPVLVGGNGPHAVERVLAYGDERLAEPEDGLEDRIAELHEGAREAGRRHVLVTLYSADFRRAQSTRSGACTAACLAPSSPNDRTAPGARWRRSLARSGCADRVELERQTS